MRKFRDATPEEMREFDARQKQRPVDRFERAEETKVGLLEAQLRNFNANSFAARALAAQRISVGIAALVIAFALAGWH